MNEKHRPQILLTNDDGINSPGIWAAAEALSKLGFVTLAAPRDQASSTGRSMPLTSDGKILPTTMRIGSQDWEVYAIGGTPAQVVLHTVLEIMPQKPDLVVSGINYGENLGNSITSSGTIGAALEGASAGIPSMAVSLQLRDITEFASYSSAVDFSTAAYFTYYFAKVLLERKMPDDVDVLKIDVPYDATPETPWKVTRQSRHRYFIPVLERNGTWRDHGRIGGMVDPQRMDKEAGTDIQVMVFERKVAVTPLSLDLTSRVDFDPLTKLLGSVETGS